MTAVPFMTFALDSLRLDVLHQEHSHFRRHFAFTELHPQND
jgi:hypothetical protein